MTLESLIYRLRKQLKDALDSNDRQECYNLMFTFQLLLDASYEFENRDLSGLLADLVYCGQHGSMGVEAKARAAFHTDEMMKKVFPSQRE
jgi:hypothetical protein